MKLLFEASERVAAPITRVQPLLDEGWALDAFLGRGGPTAYQYIDVDHRDGVVGFQGHWWYRGELSAAPENGTTLLTYRVYNIAPRLAWAVPLANKMFIGYDKQVRSSAAGLARAIEQHLT
ncbi:hypothetical protein [Cryptosporangium phraense]|uniref:SRPBCC family protein n=1 Tax=Cryptosporangium phraense TaxID=2593070 RepID=A0A545B0G4_9ACTN|nr:hypothetical protein [Cryptosporangium phraense]TQS47070.1 hypothetical protein FL583_02070 [Cryptosporangium phraense]